jgi:hypothetical protein
MSDERLDEQTAGAFGIASFYLMQSLISALIEKGVLTMKEAALIGSAAAKNSDDAVPTSPVPEMQALAQRCLATVADKWSRQAKGN